MCKAGLRYFKIFKYCEKAVVGRVVGGGGGEGGKGGWYESCQEKFMLINAEMKGRVCLNSVSSQCANGKSSLA